MRHPRTTAFGEPLSNLDAKLKVQTRREIARLHQQLSATMLYITHDQVEAMTLGDRIVVLEGRHEKQINTPMNLYERPKNTFVAAFIGSPSMNLLAGSLIATAVRDASGAKGLSGVEFRAADGAFTMALGAQWGSRLASRVGRAVILGIRPEDILILPEGSTSERVGTVRVRLDVVEPLGSEAFLSARVGAKEITARVPPRGLPAAGSEVELVFNAERLHFFDAESGETLWVE